jgi:GDP/UDP-N,N'-diacetylbacillosamine 2-epimerase (hydrolysing)
MIGNSSASIIEAPLMNKWSINIGYRQEGRAKQKTVIDCGYWTQEIRNTIDKCLLDIKLSNIQLAREFPSTKIVRVIKENIDNANLIYKKILLGGTTWIKK